jgi:hypothetical protein
VYEIFQYIQGADRNLKPDTCGILRKVLSDMQTKCRISAFDSDVSPVVVNGNAVFFKIQEVL